MEYSLKHDTNGLQSVSFLFYSLFSLCCRIFLIWQKADYSGYGSGSGYDYDYNNYAKEQNNYNQRSAYGNDTTTTQYPPSQAV